MLQQRLKLLINAKELDSARTTLDRVFAIFDRASSGVDSAQYAELVADRSTVESFSGQHPAAIRDARAAVDLWRRVLPPNDPQLASGLSRLDGTVPQIRDPELHQETTYFGSHPALGCARFPCRAGRRGRYLAAPSLAT